MNPAKALILLGHGSKAPETLEEMRVLAAKLQASDPGLSVRPAFLTLIRPDLAEAVRDAVAGGAGEIRVLPLFFFTGKHVLEDIPLQVDALRSAHPGVKVVLLEAAGRHPDFAGFVARAGGIGP